MERNKTADRFLNYIYSEIAETEFDCLGRFVVNHYVIMYNWHPDYPDYPSVRSRSSICSELKLIAELGDIFSKQEESDVT